MFDGSPYRCFRCGETGHLKANCPSRRTPAAEAPAAPPSDEGAAVNTIKFVVDPGGVKRLSVDIPGDTRGPVADAHSWANRIRETDPRFGLPHCGDPADLSASEFRRTSGLGQAHECRLRAIAAEQLAEAREGREEAAA